MQQRRRLVLIATGVVAVAAAIACVYYVAACSDKDRYDKERYDKERYDNNGAEAAAAPRQVVLYYRLADSLDRTQASLPLPQAIQDVSDAHGRVLQASPSYEQARMLLFESFNRVDQTLGVISLPKGLAFVYGLAGSDLMASKSALAKTLRAAGLQRYLPLTYVLGDAGDMARMQQEWNNKLVYIMKKNVQRQEGVLLTSSLYDVLTKGEADGYVVVQALLQDPLLVGGRKVNMRVYMLVVVDGDDVNFYMYKDGFMYYTPKPFQQLSLDPEENITTGYIDRQVYVDNPLTIQDLGRVLGDAKFAALMRNTEDMFKALAAVYAPRLRQANRGIPGIKFTVFGVDVAPDEKLGVRIMEVNKGPDLGYKDNRDKAVKHNMLLEAFKRAGVVPRPPLALRPPAMFVQVL